MVPVAAPNPPPLVGITPSPPPLASLPAFSPSWFASSPAPSFSQTPYLHLATFNLVNLFLSSHWPLPYSISPLYLEFHLRWTRFTSSHSFREVWSLEGSDPGDRRTARHSDDFCSDCAQRNAGAWTKIRRVVVLQYVVAPTCISFSPSPHLTLFLAPPRSHKSSHQRMSIGTIVRGSPQAVKRVVVYEAKELKDATVEIYRFARRHNWLKTLRIVFRRKYWSKSR